MPGFGGGISKIFEDLFKKVGEKVPKDKRSGRFEHSEVLEKLPGIGIDIKGGEGRELSEFQGLSRNIFSAESEFSKMLQTLGEEQQGRIMDVRQQQTLANIRKMKADIDQQKRLSDLGLQNLPTTGDFLFQSLMGGLGTGASIWMQRNQFQNQFQNLFPGQTPQFPGGGGFLPQGQPGQQNPFSGFG